MIRSGKFLISQRPYAVDLDSFHNGAIPTDAGDVARWRPEISAVWFRRRNGRTVATVGTLSGFLQTEQMTVQEFLEGHDDSRYGGDCAGRWDGSRSWGSQKPDTIAAHLELLRPMLDRYPAIPDGYDGWWRFR